MEDYKRILAIDFDGTIVEHAYPQIGKLMPFAKSAINLLYELNNYIIISTCRGGQELNCARFHLDLMGIKYHKINENAPFEMIGFQPFPKVFANVYIDDLNFGGFPGWQKVLFELEPDWQNVLVQLEKNERLLENYKELLYHQKDLDPKISELVDENFFDLIGNEDE